MKGDKKTVFNLITVHLEHALLNLTEKREVSARKAIYRALWWIKELQKEKKHA